jgi:hypothetical protein
MARVLFGGGVADIRGKWNGQVFGRNKGGAIMRTKVTPINPNTTFQSTQRAYMSNIAKAWAANLTDDQRKGWQTYGQILGTMSIFGNRLILSGIAVYQRINRIILAAGGTRIDDAPTSNDIQNITSGGLAVSSGGGTLTFTFAPTPYSAGQGLYIFSTPPMSPGILNFTPQLRLIGYFDTAASPLNITAAWVARFGAVPAAPGQAIGLSVRALDIGTGAVSAAANFQAIVS